MASWKALSGVPNFFADTMLLLTDGSVLVHDASASLLGGVNWYRLTPDSNGKYDTPGATWTGPFPMANARQFWASGVLKDGRVFIIGGEKSTHATRRWPNFSTLKLTSGRPSRNLRRNSTSFKAMLAAASSAMAASC
jgi:hypothetical protein